MSASKFIEFWKPIPGYGEHYEASSEGRVRVKDRVIVKKHPITGKMTENKYKSKVLSPCKSDKWGHMSVTLGVGGKDYSTSVHRLVLMAFRGYCPPGMEACHGNGVAGDNRIVNLRWDTHASNNKDRTLHGTYLIGEAHKMAKLTELQAIEIKFSKLNTDLLMDVYRVSRSQVCRIRNGQAWAHLGNRQRLKAAKLDEMDLLARTIEALN